MTALTLARVLAVDEGHAAARIIARAAIRSLHAELVCCPKPGLVTPLDCGSHRDMNAETFLRSLFALGHYFHLIAMAGGNCACFAELQQLGLAAEARMLHATRGANTHRGAIFALGLLAAAAGRLAANRRGWAAASLSATVVQLWSRDLLEHRPVSGSHGLETAWRFGAGGARAQAVAGFPAVFEIGVPALRAAHASGCDPNRAHVQTLFTLIATLEDTNLLYRGGREGLYYAQLTAAEFLAEGGVYRSSWRDRVLAIHRKFVVRNLSPGGAADMLAATCFIHLLQQ